MVNVKHPRSTPTLRRRFVMAAGTAALAWLAVTAPASIAATEIGRNSDVSSMCGALAFVQDVTPPGSPSYAVPAGGGVITSWALDNRGTTGSAKLKVFRRTALAGQFLVVGDSLPESVAAGGPRSFPTRIPVAAGDLIGVATLGAGISCIYSSPGSTIKCFSPDPASGTTATILPCQDADRSVNVTATVEPDADGDRFGDETQDGCATDPATQVACPDRTPPVARLRVSRQRIASRGFVGVFVRVNEAARLTATGTLRAGGRKVALRRRTKRAAAGSRTTLRLRLSRDALRIVRVARRQGRKIAVTVRVRVEDRAGNATGLRRSIRLRG